MVTFLLHMKHFYVATKLILKIFNDLFYILSPENGHLTVHTSIRRYGLVKLNFLCDPFPFPSYYYMLTCCKKLNYWNHKNINVHKLNIIQALQLNFIPDTM